MSDKEISELNLKSAEHYGLQLQMNHFTEELAELIQAVAECDPKHVAEEMADVEVMVEQMEYLLTLDKDVIKKYADAHEDHDARMCFWFLAAPVKSMHDENHGKEAVRAAQARPQHPPAFREAVDRVHPQH